MLLEPLLLLALVTAASAVDLASTSTTDSIKEATPPSVYKKCMTLSGAEGHCVPHSLCNRETFSDYIDIHVPVDLCESFDVVCCTDFERVLPTEQAEKVSDLTTTEPTPAETTPPSGNQKCTQRNGVHGECVPFEQCNLDVSSEYIDIHVPVEETCDFDRRYLIVCCSESERVLPTRKEPEERVGCGWRNPAGAAGVKQGTEGVTQFGEFPWICAILRVNPSNQSDNGNDDDVETTKPIYAGSGTLIHPGVLLTAAHTVSHPGEYRVRCGEWDSVHEEPLPSQEESVEEVVRHPNYTSRNLYNDFALLFLSKAMKISPHISTGCLPSPLQQVAGHSCVTTGWGRTQFGREGEYTNLLKKVELPILNHTYCEDLLRQTRLGSRFQLHDTFSCAGVEGDHCVTDSGAPVSCPIQNQPNRYVAVGAVSWSVGCSAVPLVYADFTRVRSWVDSLFEKYEFDSSTYTY